MSECAHLDQVDPTLVTAAVDGCPECLATGSTWVSLRQCMTCGHVGCCDNSPNRHATAHFERERHPVIRSTEAGETWFWCYEDHLAFGSLETPEQ
jgi:uncharacterized UBP type Zn finger protein